MEYRANFLRHDGHIAGTTILTCADDIKAMEEAKQLVGRLGIELKKGNRTVAKLDVDKPNRIG